MRIPEAYEDESGFHCECGFMDEHRRRVRRNRIVVVVTSFAALALDILWRLL